MYLQRTLERYFRAAGGHFPVMLVTGARQVGKTTFLRELAEPGRAYVTLDDPQVLELAREDPALFLQRFPPPVLIDEIQYAPGLLPHIKMQADAGRQSGAFWLTGSQQFHLMRGVSESLAGRAGIVRLLGFSRQEQEGRGAEARPFLPTPDLGRRSLPDDHRLGLRDLYRMIWRGSFPAAADLNGEALSLFHSSYVQTYLQRDIRDLARVGDEMAFYRFLRATAARTSQLLNLNELARDADLAPNTAKKWLSILVASGLVHLLEPFHTNLTRRMVKAPKLYFLDTGLAAFLTGWSSPETLEAGAMSGAFLETWVVAEVLKSWWHNGLTAPVYFYRDRDQREIDLLIVQDGTLHPVEIKKSAAPGRDALRHFRALEQVGAPVGHGGVLCLADQGLPLSRSVDLLPVGLL